METIQQPIISIKNLSKTYSDGTKALNDLSLNISYGMFGLLGPNGAGKSSLMRTLATLQDPDQGTIHFQDYNLLSEKLPVRKHLGYLPQEFGLIKNISAYDLLLYFAVLKGIVNKEERKEIVNELLQLTNLWDKRKNMVSHFSGGMKQRFGLAVALMTNPKLLIVDEPTAGLDPLERIRILNILSEISQNCAVILSTHIVEDVADICTDMAIINKGGILVKGKPISLINQLEGLIWERIINKEDYKFYNEHYKIVTSRFKNGRILIHVYSDEMPHDSTFTKPDLKDVYFSTVNGYHFFKTENIGS